MLSTLISTFLLTEENSKKYVLQQKGQGEGERKRRRPQVSQGSAEGNAAILSQDSANNPLRWGGSGSQNTDFNVKIQTLMSKSGLLMSKG